jgi:hypothetical protein
MPSTRSGRPRAATTRVGEGREDADGAFTVREGTVWADTVRGDTIRADTVA